MLAAVVTETAISREVTARFLVTINVPDVAVSLFGLCFLDIILHLFMIILSSQSYIGFTFLTK